MGNIIVGGIILVLIILGIRSVKKRAANGCCGGSGEKEKISAIKVEDQDPSHYAYHAGMKVEGMHCDNCKKRVENALNSISGVWASVNLKDGTVEIRMKESLPELKRREAVRGAGYSVRDFYKN